MAKKNRFEDKKDQLARAKADLCVEIARLEVDLQSLNIADRAAQLMRRSNADLLKLRKKFKRAVAA